MRAGGGKQKGAQFERDVCGFLSEWVTAGKRDDIFWRSAMSGGRATVRHAKGKTTASQAGDISAVSHEGHAFLRRFIVECKFVRDLSIQSALLKRAGLLYQYWQTLEKEAAKHNRRPLLIAKENGSDKLAFLRTADRHHFLDEKARGLALFTTKQLGVTNTHVSCYKLSTLLSFNYPKRMFR